MTLTETALQNARNHITEALKEIQKIVYGKIEGSDSLTNQELLRLDELAATLLRLSSSF